MAEPNVLVHPRKYLLCIQDSPVCSVLIRVRVRVCVGAWLRGCVGALVYRGMASDN